MLAPVFLIAVAGLAAAADIYVDAAAPIGGDGTSPATAYRTIQSAVADANGRADGATIRVAEGTYVEAVNTTITRANVKILGSTLLELDARGLPTGAVASAARVKPASAGRLLRVERSGFEVSGIVFDGGGVSATLLYVDGFVGAAEHRSLEEISIHGNCFEGALQGVMLRLANATVAGNFFARSSVGFQGLGGFEPDAEHPWPEQQIVFDGNRVVDHDNGGAAFNGHVGSKIAPTFAAGPGALHAVVTNNDFAGNGDGFYPQPIQYSALLFNVMHGDNSDPLQGARVDATVGFNTFAENGYAVAVGERLRPSAPTGAYAFYATLFHNSYCGNGLNDLLVDFGLPSQSHGGAAGGATFRYAVGATYDIDATGDGLTLGDVDYDHPVEDPRLPVTAPGTLTLDNTFIFNDATIPPVPTHVPPAPPPMITRPPELSPGVFAPVATVPPEIESALATPAVLWPPDHRMVPVTIAIDATDECDPDPSSEIVSVTSNEPINGAEDGDTEPDWEVTGPLSLNLRAERAGDGAGRVYTVTVRCTDTAGNSSTAEVAVVAPLVQGPPIRSSKKK